MTTQTIKKTPGQVRGLVAIASGKGGVGKTWFSITLAHLLARSGRRVLLFDGDIGLANVDVQLGLTPTKDLSNALHEGMALKDIIVHYDAGNFDVIAGRSGSASLAATSPEALQRLIGELVVLQASYDVILLDLAAGVEQHVKTLAAACSQCVTIVTDEPTSLTDAYAFIKLALTDTPDMQLSLVINQADTQKSGQVTANTLTKACENFLKKKPELLGIIRKDNKIRDAIRHQTSLITRSPNCTAASDLAAISIKLLQSMT